MAKADISAQRLRELLAYDPQTGVFTRLVNRAKFRAGEVAGSYCKGRLSVRVAGVTYYAHRLAWLYVNGEWPDGYIDHINGDPADNRIANLRVVTMAVNNQNRRSPRKDNRSSGLMGVYRRNSGNWCSAIRLDGKQYHLGTFASADLAHAAYLVAKRRLHEGCTI